jgi:hypothetical protein
MRKPMRLTWRTARGRAPRFREAYYRSYERQNRKNSFDCLIVSGSGLARSIHRPHQQRQIARRRLDQQFLVHIPNAPNV